MIDVTATLRSLLPTPSDYAGLRRSWRGDVLAGITVGVVALPLALAFGVATGLGAQAGLMTAIVAGAVAALFGGSNVQVSGPTGAMTAVLIPVVAQYGVGAVGVVGLMAGVLILGMVLAGFGRYLEYLPWPVIEGFTVGIAAIIFLLEVPAALGDTSPDAGNTALAALSSLGRAATAGNLASVGVAALTVAVLLGVTRLHRALPSSLVAVAVATAAAEVLGLDVPRIGALPGSLTPLALPAIPFDQLGRLFSAALAVAVLAALESLLSARVADGMGAGPRHNPDRELFGQALANLASTLFGGMPATGAIARTAVNIRAGARTRVAAMTHSLVLVLVVAFTGSLIARIPLAVLAGVLMVTALRMVDLSNVRAILRANRSDALVLLATAAATIAFDLIVAIEVGVISAAALALRAVARASTVSEERLGADEDPENARSAGLFDEGIISYRLDGALFFGAAQSFLHELTSVSDAEVVILRMPGLQVIDATGAAALGEIIAELQGRGITVILKGPRPEHLKTLRAVGVFERLEHESHVIADLPAAVAHARSHLRRRREAGAATAGA